ncbi:hypothetical protein RGR602_CH01197 [Rhizobium gallicum bv. gallicum R602sp]|uniref:Uncharacterized protein n=1 Tax=Rhizobium gallicum bv. gallicum R602sp TaxID=1041138 RepID=A0A0B4X1E0_9HYPH|nr:hypothetical protein RGR602_CH01197 [Rhizobium gallicum bv. gallicum R602sp]
MTAAGGKGIALRVDGVSDGCSPDRLGGLVLALTTLILDGGGEPKVRGFEGSAVSPFEFSGFIAAWAAVAPGAAFRAPGGSGATRFPSGRRGAVEWWAGCWRAFAFGLLSFGELRQETHDIGQMRCKSGA